MKASGKSVVLCAHTKCGTRWIAQVVQSNPNLRYVRWNEVTDDTVDRLSDDAANGSRPLFIDYPHALQNDAVLNRLKRIDPQMRAIVIYRDPVDIIVSKHNYAKPAYGTGFLSGPHENISYDETVRDSDFVESLRSGLLRRIFEAEYRFDLNARRLRETFTGFAEYRYDDLVDDAEGFAVRMFGFCGVPAVYRLPPGRINRSVAFKSQLAHKVIMKALYVGTGVDTNHFMRHYADGKMQPSILRALLRANDAPSSFLTQAQRNEVRALLSPMLAEFAKVTDLDVGRWMLR